MHVKMLTKVALGNYVNNFISLCTHDYLNNKYPHTYFKSYLFTINNIVLLAIDKTSSKIDTDLYIYFPQHARDKNFLTHQEKLMLTGVYPSLPFLFTVHEKKHVLSL